MCANGSAGHDRGIKAEVRTVLLRSIALGRRWLDQVLAGTSVDEVAALEGCTKQHVANAAPPSAVHWVLKVLATSSISIRSERAVP